MKHWKWFVPALLTTVVWMWWTSQPSGIRKESAPPPRSETPSAGTHGEVAVPEAVPDVEPPATPPRVGETPSSAERGNEWNREELARLIREDPDRAIALAPTRAEWEALSPERRAETPEPVSGVGELAVEYVGCDVDHVHNHDPRVERVAFVNGRRFRAHMAEARRWEGSRADVWLHGVALDGHLAVSSTPLRRLRPGEEGYLEDGVQAEWRGRILNFESEAALEAGARRLLNDEQSAVGPRVTYRSPTS